MDYNQSSPLYCYKNGLSAADYFSSNFASYLPYDYKFDAAANAVEAIIVDHYGIGNDQLQEWFDEWVDNPVEVTGYDKWHEIFLKEVMH